MLATCAELKVRDGKKAVEHARKACELTDWKLATHLGTLAAAYAQAGQFDEAIKWEKKALEDKEYEKEFGTKGREMLKRFEQKLAYPENN